MDINNWEPRKMSSFGLVAAGPALVMGLMINAIFIVTFPVRNSWILFMIITFLIVSVLTFVENLVIPVATNRNMAITMALPTVIIFIYTFAIRPFFTSINPGNQFEDIGFLILWACIFDPPIEVLLLTGLAYFSRLGAKLNKRFFHGEQSRQSISL